MARGQRAGFPMVGKWSRRIVQTTRDNFFVNDNGFRNGGLTARRKRAIGVGGREAGEEDVWGLWGQAPRRDTEGEPPKCGGGVIDGGGRPRFRGRPPDCIYSSAAPASPPNWKVFFGTRFASSSIFRTRRSASNLKTMTGPLNPFHEPCE